MSDVSLSRSMHFGQFGIGAAFMKRQPIISDEDFAADISLHLSVRAKQSSMAIKRQCRSLHEVKGVRHAQDCGPSNRGRKRGGFGKPVRKLRQRFHLVALEHSFLGGALKR